MGCHPSVTPFEIPIKPGLLLDFGGRAAFSPTHSIRVPFGLTMEYLALLWIIPAIIIAFGVVAWILHVHEQKKRAAFLAVAQELGLSFDPDCVVSLASRFPFLSKLDRGSNRYAQYVMSGRYRARSVIAFEYHYETYTWSKTGRQTHHHYLTVFVLELDAVFPELI